MAQNDFLVFNENDNNTLTQSEYLTDSQRIGGLQGGIASSKLHNKVFKQLSTATYALAKIITDSGQDALDSDPEAFYNNLKTVLQQVQGATEGIAGILELVSNNDVDAVNPANESSANDTKAVTLRKIVRGIKNRKLIQQASETIEGVTRYATQNEVFSANPPSLCVGADVLRAALQDASLIANATTTKAGKIRIATQAEAEAGTSTNTAVTPAILKQLKEMGILSAIKQIYRGSFEVNNSQLIDIHYFPTVINPNKSIYILNEHGTNVGGPEVTLKNNYIEFYRKFSSSVGQWQIIEYY